MNFRFWPVGAGRAPAAGGRFNTAIDRLPPDARHRIFHLELVYLLQYFFSCDTEEPGLPSPLLISSEPEFWARDQIPLPRRTWDQGYALTGALRRPLLAGAWYSSTESATAPLLVSSGSAAVTTTEWQSVRSLSF